MYLHIYSTKLFIKRC